MIHLKIDIDLNGFIPSSALLLIDNIFWKYPARFRIAKRRSSKNGDYQWLFKSQTHEISINQGLNQYAFLITLIHEIAHLKVWENYLLKYEGMAALSLRRRRLKPHGSEWKSEYVALLSPFIKQHVFPKELEKQLIRHMHRPKAASCTDVALTVALRAYNEDSSALLIGDLEEDQLFTTQRGTIFRKGKKLRKRFKCYEQGTDRVFLFSPIAEVIPVTKTMDTL
ncbi:MAG: hypothetical protein IIA45_05475 [Bacteroidetes bacterium]|nr:hypothetical protein [Bacteroidota bacterium]